MNRDISEQNTENTIWFTNVSDINICGYAMAMKQYLYLPNNMHEKGSNFDRPY